MVLLGTGSSGSKTLSCGLPTGAMCIYVEAVITQAGTDNPAQTTGLWSTRMTLYPWLVRCTIPGVRITTISGNTYGGSSTKDTRRPGGFKCLRSWAWVTRSSNQASSRRNTTVDVLLGALLTWKIRRRIRNRKLVAISCERVNRWPYIQVYGVYQLQWGLEKASAGVIITIPGGKSIWLWSHRPFLKVYPTPLEVDHGQLDGRTLAVR